MTLAELVESDSECESAIPTPHSWPDDPVLTSGSGPWEAPHRRVHLPIMNTYQLYGVGLSRYLKSRYPGDQLTPRVGGF